MALTDQVIMPGSDYQAICDATRKLTGETATLKSGEISTELDLVTPLYEMWVLSKEGVAEGNMNIAAHFYTRTLDEEFTRIIFSLEDGSLRYIRPDGSNELVAEATSQIGENEHQYSWVGNPEYRAIVCKTPPTGALLTWLQANGVKQASYTAVETNHTCSGTVFDLQNSTITSEAPYDAMQKVTLNITIPEQEKTVSPTETSQTVTPDTRKVLSKVTVNPISSTYVGSAITRQPAKTITPSSTSQIAVPAGKYTTGAVTIEEIPKSYIGPLAPSADCAAILANVSISAGTLSGTTLSLTRRLSTDGNSNIANKVIKQGDEYVDETSVTVPTEEKTITPSWTGYSSSYSPTSGKLIRRVVVNKPSTLISSNIKKGVDIGGITGRYDGDDVYVKNVSTIHVTTREGTITLRTPVLARYLCVRTRSGNLYVASADIRSISSWNTAGESISLDITRNGSAYDYAWNLFRSEDPDYDGAYMTVYIIDD